MSEVAKRWRGAFLMESDQVDLFMEQWKRERPDLNSSSLGIVSRILMLSKWLEVQTDRALGRFGLSLWQFDVLAALRRSGEPFQLSPTQLMHLVTLTSGAMTNRIDRLEEFKLVVREPDPNDRRGVLIRLTPEGKKLVDEAIPVRLEESQRNLVAFSRAEEKTLTTLLRKFLLTLPEPPVRTRLNGARLKSSDL